MRVIGIDPGTAIVGYAILDKIGNKVKLIDYGCIYTDKDDIMPKRLEIIYDRLDTLIKLYKPDSMAIEELFYFKNQKTVIKVGQARGVINLVAQKNGIEIFNYTPLQVKISVTSYGRATKKQVQEMVKILLNLNEIPKPDDAADAIAIALTKINDLSLSLETNQKIKTNSLKAGNKITIEEYRELIKK